MDTRKNTTHDSNIFSASSILRCTATALLLLAFPVILFARPTNDTYSIIVYKLYRDYAWQAIVSWAPEQFEKELGTIIDHQPISTLKQYFDDSLSALLAADCDCVTRTREICAIDADIIFDSQDQTAMDLKITEKGDNTVLVQYTYPPNGQTIQIEYKTIMTDKGWRITDIIYSRESKRYSLREMLTSFPYNEVLK